MIVTTKHKERIKQELKAAGVSKYGLMKFTSHYLPNVIHEDEHIGGVAYGRYPHGTGLLAFEEGMLVATDRRVIFLDHKPGFTTFDEITYDVVSGIKLTSAGFSAITLHTRLGDYLLRFINPTAAKNFARYVEHMRLETDRDKPKLNVKDSAPEAATSHIKMDENSMNFLKSHDVAVLSTISRRGNLHGAVVYYHLEGDLIYILTKSETHKAHNTMANNQIALTVYDTEKMQTVQIQGTAAIESDQTVKERVFTNLVKLRQYGDEKRMPPVTQLSEGSFMVIKITPTEAKYSDFKK